MSQYHTPQFPQKQPLNDSRRAFFYEPYGITLDKSFADSVVAASDIVTKENYGWAAKVGQHSIISKEIKLLDQ